jgi:hypothetical protein
MSDDACRLLWQAALPTHCASSLLHVRSSAQALISLQQFVATHALQPASAVSWEQNELGMVEQIPRSRAGLHMQGTPGAQSAMAVQVRKQTLPPLLVWVAHTPPGPQSADVVQKLEQMPVVSWSFGARYRQTALTQDFGDEQTSPSGTGALELQLAPATKKRSAAKVDGRARLRGRRRSPAARRPSSVEEGLRTSCQGYER